MRMWMTNPRHMCQKHLCGEHVEHHMFVAVANSGKRLDGYVDNNLLEYRSLQQRHDALAKEMKRRGYNHRSPLGSLNKQQPAKVLNSKVDVKASLIDLHSRCPHCRALAHKESQ